MELNNYSLGDNGKTRSHIRTVALCLMSIAKIYAATQSDMPQIGIQELKAMMDKGTPATIIDVQPEKICAAWRILKALFPCYPVKKMAL